MLMMAIWGMFDTVNIVMSGALKGAGDTRFVMIYMLILGWAVWLPGEWLIFHRHGGILPAWIWLTVYVLFLSVGFWWRWESGRNADGSNAHKECRCPRTDTAIPGLLR